MMSQPLLIINVAGLGTSAVGPLTPNISRLSEKGTGALAVKPPVPALTSPCQATLLTGSPPAEHGIVSNGWYFRDLAQILNWQRSGNLVAGESLWQAARVVSPNLQCANLFWRYATHSACNVNVVERPTYWADGRKSPDIYTEPGSVRDELVERFGPFPLFRFWGPVADIQSTRWIVDATIHCVEQDRFGLVLTYIPHLDYDHQRFGPGSEQGKQALRDMDREVGRLIEAAFARGMNVAVVSDYAFEPVSCPVFLNRALREAGLVTVQRAENGELLEPGACKAFAVCDQQAAHIYVNDQFEIQKTKRLLETLHGVQRVYDRREMGELELDHPRAGELFAIAEPGCWFAYPYWLDESHAPDFAHCVAIHAKPGWDPSELFWRPGPRGTLHLAKRMLQKALRIRAPFDLISGDMSLVGGSHGRIPASDEHCPVFITSWPLQQTGSIRMQDIKPLLLQRLGRPKL
ncbi:MAG: alkaline phosphatase family protein [Planctomycetota bacterium]